MKTAHAGGSSRGAPTVIARYQPVIRADKNLP